jgi:hypothetical protein
MGQIIPILYKGGIQKDGSDFQGEYCTDSQWIRFVNKMPQSMGGIESIPTMETGNVPNQGDPINFGNVKTFASINGYIYFSVPIDNGNGRFKLYRIRKLFVGANFGGQIPPIESLELGGEFGGGNFSVTQIFSFFTTDEKKFIAFYVNSNDTLGGMGRGRIPSYMYLLEQEKTLTQANLKGPFVLRAGKKDGSSDIALEASPPNNIFGAQGFAGDGGVIFSAPYLFFYGSDGHIFWTRGEAYANTFIENVNPKALVIPGKILEKPIAISNEKIVYGALTRGGATTPTIIFWTTGSVIKFSNSGELTDSAKGYAIKFNVQVITNEISILSNKCVVNYNGVFYWVGRGVFYTYSGVVDTLKNTTNQQFFHENINYNRANQVFAVKYPTKNEIWWFYPSKNANIGVCDSAIIYNVQDDVWYNTGIDAQSGYFDSNVGEFFTYGLGFYPRRITNISDVRGFWKLETGFDQLDTRSVQIRDVPFKIDSYFVTPWISYATFNNFKQPVGNKKFMQVKQIEPNFAITQSDDRNNSKMYVQILGKNFANSETITSNKITFNKQTEYISISNFQARNIAFKFGREDTDVSFKAGISFFEADEGDGQV